MEETNNSSIPALKQAHYSPYLDEVVGLLHHQCLHGADIVQRDEAVAVAVQEAGEHQRAEVALQNDIVHHRRQVMKSYRLVNYKQSRLSRSRALT
jgi:hypothetical protein